MGLLPPELAKFLGMAALPLVAMAIGWSILRTGLRERRRAKLLDETEPRSIRDVEPGDGFVFVSGAAEPFREGPTEAEIVGSEAVLVATDVKSKTTSMGSGTSPSWTTDHESSEAVPFVLDDGTGRAHVDLPEEAAIRLRTRARERVSHDALVAQVGDVPEDVPEGVRRYVETHDTAATGTRRYEQGAVETGGYVAVFAEAVEGPTGFAAPDVTLTGDGHPELVVASDEDDVAGEVELAWRWLVAIGGAVTFLGTSLTAVLAFAILL